MRQQARSADRFLKTKANRGLYLTALGEPLRFKTPTLPFDYHDLEPWVSADTVETHFNQHHCKYVENSNKLLAGAERSYKTLEDALFLSSGKLYNNVTQAWNHTFFWKSMQPEDSGKPWEISDKLKSQIANSFQNASDIQEDIIKLGSEHFGSGWVWIVANTLNNGNHGKISVLCTHESAIPDRTTSRPLWVCDLWEHAYYLDYKSGRKKFLEGAVDNINWKFVDANYAQDSFPDLGSDMLERT